MEGHSSQKMLSHSTFFTTASLFFRSCGKINIHWVPEIFIIQSLCCTAI